MDKEEVDRKEYRATDQMLQEVDATNQAVQ
jgi:hypothetical protein